MAAAGAGQPLLAFSETYWGRARARMHPHNTLTEQGRHAHKGRTEGQEPHKGAWRAL